VRIAELDDPEQLEELRDLWLALHRHHREVVRFDGLEADDDTSWTRRRATYAEWLAAGDALILVARDDGGAPAAYAAVHLQDGPDDTFAVGDRHAELYSLSVLPAHRSAGLGTRLMDEVDRRLDELGIAELAVSVMADNAAARRFYERRGLTEVEVSYRRSRRSS
jgi:ribosomal protein S18 acetylase RimI-like enzyme